MNRLIIFLAAISTSLVTFNSFAINIQSWSTAKQTNVYFVEKHNLPIVDINIMFHAGSAYDEKHFGIATLTASLLNQGANGKSANDIALAFDDVGALYSSDVKKDYASISLRTLSEAHALDTATHLLKTIVTQPSFPNSAFLRTKQQLIAAIKHSNDTPGQIANKTFFETLYPHHPYGHPSIGTLETLDKITNATVHRFYQEHYAANQSALVIVGDISLKKAKMLAEFLTSDLAIVDKSTKLPKVPPIAAMTKAVPFKSSQTVIRIGQLGIDYHNKDYFPLIVGNYILGGGGLVSRLADEIREKRGLSYGVGSFFIPLLARGPFIISLATKSQQTTNALEVTDKTVKQYITKGPTKQELIAAKKYLTGSFPLKLSSNRDILNMVSLIGFYRLPLDYLDTYTDNIKAVTLSDINHAVKRWLHPKAFITITVGQV